jgi:hypothetical protein
MAATDQTPETIRLDVQAQQTPLRQAMKASEARASDDNLLGSLQDTAADFQDNLIQSILENTRGAGYERSRHLAELMPLRRGMETIGQGTATDLRNTLFIVTHLKALISAQMGLRKSVNGMERAIYDWRYHMDLVTAYNVEVSILKQQYAYFQDSKTYQ